MKYQPRNFIVRLFPLLLAVELVTAVKFFPEAMRGNTDARQFYVGGYMLRTGHRREFYDAALQQRLEERLASPMRGLLPVNHPAAEYLIWVPFSLLSYGKAYVAFAIFSSLVLAACFLLLRGKVKDDRLLAASFLGFPPVMIALIQSQDSILLLLLVCLAYVSQNELVSGLLIGLGVFKFALVLPIGLLYVLWRRWRFVAGFALSAGAVALVTLMLIGVRQSIHYVHFIFQTEYLPAKAISNLRGVVGVLGGNPLLGVAASLTLILLCWRAKPSLTLALPIALMSSYQTLPHDLVLLLIGVSVEKRWISYVGSAVGMIGSLAFLCTVPILVEQFLWFGPFSPVTSPVGTIPQGRM
jgi:Glycosyltransferase family 87